MPNAMNELEVSNIYKLIKFIFKICNGLGLTDIKNRKW